MILLIKPFTFYVQNLNMLPSFLAQFHALGLFYCIIVFVLFQMQWCYFAILFSAGSILKYTECRDHF